MVLDGERCEEQQYDGNAERRANSADHDTNYLLWTFWVETSVKSNARAGGQVIGNAGFSAFRRGDIRAARPGQSHFS